MRTLLITGANSEIAYEYIKTYGQDYKSIIMHYGHRKDRIDQLMESYDNIIPVQADLENKSEVENLINSIKEYEIYEYLHLAAPKLRHERFVKCAVEEFEKETQVVCWSFLRISQQLIPSMCKKHEGRILAVLTEYTVTNQPAYLSHYITGKFALLGLVKSIASEYGPKGIRVNGMSPGMINTDFISKLPQYVIDDNAKATAEGRNLCVNDLIPTIHYLLSEESTGINGQNILLKK